MNLFCQSSQFIGALDLSFFGPTLCCLLTTMFIHCKHQVVQFCKCIAIMKTEPAGFAFTKTFRVLQKRQIYSVQHFSLGWVFGKLMQEWYAWTGNIIYVRIELPYNWVWESHTSRHTNVDGRQRQTTPER